MVGGWIQGRSASAYSGTAFCVRGRKPGSALRDAATPQDAPGQRGDADGIIEAGPSKKSKTTARENVERLPFLGGTH